MFIVELISIIQWDSLFRKNEYYGCHSFRVTITELIRINVFCLDDVYRIPCPSLMYTIIVRTEKAPVLDRQQRDDYKWGGYEEV
jgi:hypothetical protein